MSRKPYIPLAATIGLTLAEFGETLPSGAAAVSTVTAGDYKAAGVYQ